jgi:hypothetical protein
MKFRLWLEATKEEFFKLADSQRGKPEIAMRDFQAIMGGGVMNYVTEHIGDLTHRMAEKPTFDYAGYGYVKRKVENCLNSLTREYGFENEFEKNIRNNAIHYNIPEDEYRSKIYSALEKYAEEHEKLKTYNKAQEAAKQAAVNLGRRKYNKVIENLQELNSHLSNSEEWVRYAHENLD